MRKQFSLRCFLKRERRMRPLLGLVLLLGCVQAGAGAARRCAQHNALFTPHNLPVSTSTCQGDTPQQRRCLFQNVFILEGVIFLIAEEGTHTEAPAVLCSAVTKTHQHAKYCQFRIVNKIEMYEIITGKNSSLSPQKARTVTGQNKGCVREMNHALAFGRLARANCYHSIFEDLIPIYETLTLYPNLFYNWLWPNNAAGGLSSHDKTNNAPKNLRQLRDMMFFIGDESPDYDLNYYTYRFWKRFFPHILLVDRFAHGDIYFVKKLVAGYNSSCVHYYHCSRDSFTTPNIAYSFRQYILSRVGILTDEQNKIDAFNHSFIFQNQTNVITRKSHTTVDTNPILVTIIQRNVQESRRLLNMEDVLSVCRNVFKGALPVSEFSPCVVKFYSEMSLDDQIIQTFSSDFIISAHGGALGNLIFAKNRSTIIDIYPYSFPYSFHGLVNWIRHSMSEKLFIGHFPFEITNAEDMYFRNRSFLTPLSPCLCNTTTRYVWFKCGFGKMFYRCAGMKLNIRDLTNHLIYSMLIWEKRHQNTVLPEKVDPRPLSKDSFKRVSLSHLEPWYYDKLRTSHQSALAVYKLPDCSDHALFRSRRRRGVDDKSKKGP